MLTEQEKKLLKQILDLPGHPIPFHAADNALVQALTNIIRELKKETKTNECLEDIQT